MTTALVLWSAALASLSWLCSFVRHVALRRLEDVPSTRHQPGGGGSAPELVAWLAGMAADAARMASLGCLAVVAIQAVTS